MKLYIKSWVYYILLLFIGSARIDLIKAKKQDIRLSTRRDKHKKIGMHIVGSVALGSLLCAFGWLIKTKYDQGNISLDIPDDHIQIQNMDNTTLTIPFSPDDAESEKHSVEEREKESYAYFPVPEVNFLKSGYYTFLLKDNHVLIANKVSNSIKVLSIEELKKMSSEELKNIGYIFELHYENDAYVFYLEGDYEKMLTWRGGKLVLEEEKETILNNFYIGSLEESDINHHEGNQKVYMYSCAMLSKKELVIVLESSMREVFDNKFLPSGISDIIYKYYLSILGNFTLNRLGSSMPKNMPISALTGEHHCHGGCKGD